MAVTTSKELDPPKGCTPCTLIDVNGRRVCGMTSETDPKRVEHFVELVRQNETEFDLILVQAEKDLAWNIRESDAGRNGKDWPSFRQKDRLISRLMKQAGIRNS